MENLHDTAFVSFAAPNTLSGEIPTVAQLKYAKDLLSQRDWLNYIDTRYIRRCTALTIGIQWVLGPVDTEATPRAIAAIIRPHAHNAGRALNIVFDRLRNTPSVCPAEAGMWRPFTRMGASALIAWLLTLPAKNAPVAAERTPETTSDPTPSAEEVPAGRYALTTREGANNDVAFYVVDRPTEGQWAGFVFVRHVVGGERIRVSPAMSKSVLHRIAREGAVTCSTRYGRLIGECGVCGRTLTNEESRRNGIGPICAAKIG